MKSPSDFLWLTYGVIARKEQIEALEWRFMALTREAGIVVTSATDAPVPVPRAKRRLSGTPRRKLINTLARVRKMRWSKASPRKRRICAAGRAAVSAGAKARLAEVQVMNG